MSNLEELNALYRDTLARAEGESANEGSEHKDPDSWLLARGTEGGGVARVVVPGGADDAAAADAEQAAIAANQALAQLQAAKTEAEQLVVDLRARLAEMDDLDTFTQRVNYYREKQDELEALLAEVTATRTAAETAQTNATLMRSVANQTLDDVTFHDIAIAQSLEANEYAINQWRQELGNANNVYTGLEMLGLSQASTFAGLLASMAKPSVGYFSLLFDGGDEPVFVQTMFGRDREFVDGLAYQMFLTINRNEQGYMASVAWTAHDSNNVFSPVAYEDRTVMGSFDTGWVVRQYVQAPTVYGG